MAGQTVLKVLLREQHMQEHKAFCREYDKIALTIDRTLVGGGPSKATFYRWLSGNLLRLPQPDSCRVLAKMFPGWSAEDLFKPWVSSELPRPASQPQNTDRQLSGDVLSTIAGSISMRELAGYWVTCFRFHEFGRLMHHADIAHIVPLSNRAAKITNYVPGPRTEGHAPGFRNTVEVQLVSRHLIGFWKNVTDNYYFGSLHLAILPGENVIEGSYTGFTNDITIVTERWKWLRLNPAALQGVSLEGVTLRDPRVVYDLVADHSHAGDLIELASIAEGVTGGSD